MHYMIILLQRVKAFDALRYLLCAKVLVHIFFVINFLVLSKEKTRREIHRD